MHNTEVFNGGYIIEEHYNPIINIIQNFKEEKSLFVHSGGMIVDDKKSYDDQ